MKHSFRLLAAFICLFSYATYAQASEGHEPHKTANHEAAIGTPGKAADIDRTITIQAHEIAFDVKDIKVKAGETVRFILINKGEQPHELALGSADEMAEHRQMMVDMAGMDMSGMHHNEGNSISTEPGETKELIWHFAKAGVFEFSCNYPGHSEIGMTGPLTVQ